MVNCKHCGGNDCHDSDFHFQHQEVVLSCGKGTGLNLPVGGSGGCAGGAGNRWPPALVVGTVSLDTSSRSKPTVKIDFSSLINFGATSVGGDYFLGIIFQLSKISNCGAKIPQATWVFEKKADNLDVICAPGCAPNGAAPAPIPAPVQVENRENFTLSWCECDPCPGCYTYILEIIDFESAFIDFASITNVSISAMAI